MVVHDLKGRTSLPQGASDHGIIPRAAFELFARLCSEKAVAGAQAAPAGLAGGVAAGTSVASASAAAADDDDDVKVVCSYLEIYQDRLYDLLQPYKKGLSR
jgi:hypothetical protein